MAGFPSVDLVMAWKRVDFPTLARPTYASTDTLATRYSGIRTGEAKLRTTEQTIRRVRTYYTALQAVARPSQEDLLPLDRLLGRHFLLPACEASRAH